MFHAYAYSDFSNCPRMYLLKLTLSSSSSLITDIDERQPSIGFSFADLITKSKKKKSKNDLLNLESTDVTVSPLLKSETVVSKPSCPWLSSGSNIIQNESKSDKNSDLSRIDMKEKVKVISMKEINSEEEKARLESNLKSLKGIHI